MESAEISGKERRKHARVCPEGLLCDVGEVLNISAGGVRLLTKRALKDPVELRFWRGKDGVVLSATIVWSRREGFRQHVIGLQFADPSQVQIQKLMDIALRGGEDWNTGSVGDLFDQLGK